MPTPYYSSKAINSVKTNITNQSTVPAPEPFIIGSVTSKDGTTVSYRQLGRGPGIVLLHGAMESAKSHMRLAGALADAFTIYLPERRGHTLGVPFVKAYRMQQEVDDLEALLTTTGATSIFGVSAGGLICLQAALTLPGVHKVAVYEPALVVNESASTALLPRYDREIVQGNVAAALVTGMQASQLGPPIFNVMPRWLLELLTKAAMKSEDKKTKSGDVTMKALAPTLHYDFQLIAEMAEALENFTAICTEVLLLGGSKSPVWLKVGLASLEKVLPHAKRIEFPGLDHGGSSDDSSTNRGGQPERVAEELRRFFA
jgi:pimeloyl-ACP methyl ester carboxylesterase